MVAMYIINTISDCACDKNEIINIVNAPIILKVAINNVDY